MHGNVCTNRDSEESIIDIKNGAEKNFRTVFYIIIGRKYIRNMRLALHDVHFTARILRIFLSYRKNMWITYQNILSTLST